MVETSAHTVIVRAPRPGARDAEAVAELVNIHSIAETGAPDVTPEQISTEWREPGRDLANDDILLEVPGGRIVGYLELESRPPWTRVRIDGYVHPERWGRGLGTRLLDLAERRAREFVLLADPGVRVVVQHGLYEGSPGAPLLESSGYRPIRTFLRMHRDLGEPPDPASWPEGIVVRTAGFDPDRQLLHRTLEDGFADHWGFQPTTFERWLHAQTVPGRFDPDLWFLAVEGDEAVGAIVCRSSTVEDPDCGWVEDLAVRRAWRGRGLGLALLLHAFGRLHARGVRTVALAVDSENPTGAMGLYGRAGMRPVRRVDLFEKELRASAEADVTPGV